MCGSSLFGVCYQLDDFLLIEVCQLQFVFGAQLDEEQNILESSEPNESVALHNVYLKPGRFLEPGILNHV